MKIHVIYRKCSSVCKTIHIIIIHLQQCKLQTMHVIGDDDLFTLSDRHGFCIKVVMFNIITSQKIGVFMKGVGIVSISSP